MTAPKGRAADGWWDAAARRVVAAGQVLAGGRRAAAGLALAAGFTAGMAGEANAQERPGWVGIAVEITTTSDGGAPLTVVRVADVQQGSPAEQAGVRPGDVLLEVNELVGPIQLQQLAQRLRLSAGDSVRMVVRRSTGTREIRLAAGHRPAVLAPPVPSRAVGPHPDSLVASIMREMDSLRVRLSEGERPVRVRVLTTRDGQERTPWPPAAPHPDPQAWMDVSGTFSPLAPYVLGRNRVAGAEVIDIRTELAGYFGVGEGVLVVDVPDGTPAASADLRPGDVIVELNGHPVASVRDLRIGVARGEQALPVWVVRRGERVRLLLDR